MFSKYVRPEVIHRATFNYCEPSFVVDKDGRRFTVYHTKFPVRPQPNIVVVEACDDPEELYFGAFLGKHSGECETRDETKAFFREIDRTISPEFRVDGRELESVIISFLDRVSRGQLN